MRALTPHSLPGQRIGHDGKPRLDYAAIGSLAFPFMLNSSVQAILNATDTWFIGRLSANATSAIGAVYWPVLVFLVLLGGVGISVQTLVAQCYGARRYARAAQAAWVALWAAAFTVPLFAILAFCGTTLFAPFGIPAESLPLAMDYWMPRMLCAPLGVALWGQLGFFNGISRPRITLALSVTVAVVNAILNQIFIFEFGWGIAGSAWATGAAQGVALLIAVWIFLGPEMRGHYRSHLTTRLQARALLSQFKLGFPMGLLYAADILGFSLFQLMQVHLGTVDGAATQLVMMLTSFVYMPAVGIAMAGTTLVGQSIGAGNRDWAARLGNGIILLVVLYMGSTGVVLAALGPWVLPWFQASADPRAAEVVAKAGVLLWIAAGYQLFDGLNISSGSCLRGAGDALIPSFMVIALSWLVFVPLAHALSFSSGQGWFDFLPAYGYGAVGGWWAAVAYIMALGIMLLLRWRSGAWRRIDLKFSH
jgi:MATE family multidrug resistance protein